MDLDKNHPAIKPPAPFQDATPPTEKEKGKEKGKEERKRKRKKRTSLLSILLLQVLLLLLPSLLGLLEQTSMSVLFIRNQLGVVLGL